MKKLSTLSLISSLVILLLTLTTQVETLQRFFFLSELVWIFLFIFLLNYELLISNVNLLSNCFLILVFTAVESLIFAAILLLNHAKVI